MSKYSYPFQTADEATKLRVWQKGSPIAGYNPVDWRADVCGHAMKFADHGDTNSRFGWEIDHIKPTAKGGQDTWDNVQPLYWETNRSKGDQWPWDCSMA